MNARTRFFIVLAVYLAWVAALGVMALTSGEAPKPQVGSTPLSR